VTARWLVVCAVSVVAGGLGGFGAAELSRPVTVRAAHSLRDNDSREQLGILQLSDAIPRLEARVQRVAGCMPELIAYINLLTNGLDASHALTSACATLFYPEGLPKN
jgi:hypothetical protein